MIIHDIEKIIHHDYTYYLAKEKIWKKDGNYECSFGSSDHVVLEIDIKGDIKIMQEESYKK